MWDVRIANPVSSFPELEKNYRSTVGILVVVAFTSMGLVGLGGWLPNSPHKNGIFYGTIQPHAPVWVGPKYGQNSLVQGSNLMKLYA
jgi:hypothetical protein